MLTARRAGRALASRARLAAAPTRCISLFSSDPEPDAVDEPSLAQTILGECERLHASIQPVNTRLHGPLERNADKHTMLPFVLMLGNHSSGKSSFINYVLERPIQTAGVAPTDDSFTIIAPGPSDMDQDGPALVGDPDMGFSGLRHFGPNLVNHMRIKIRKDTSTSDFMMVDSPGMIDSPVTKQWASDGAADAAPSALVDRGYNFEKTVGWFAERADVILLFFDPDKPGTTGETLSIVTNSLVGMDHKLYIILNKADKFARMEDFARSYGSLCWNLSKIIPRKDLPRIHTMCLPVPNRDADSDTASAMGASLDDLEKTRDLVVEEVRKAPKRRVDNMITRLSDAVSLLVMHASVVEAARKRNASSTWGRRAQLAAAATAGASLTTASVFAMLPVQVSLATGAFSVAGTAAFQFYLGKLAEAERADLTGEQGLTGIFQALYARDISEGDEHCEATWQRVRAHVRRALDGDGLAGMPATSAAEMDKLRYILDTEIPKLRRLASPMEYADVRKQWRVSRPAAPDEVVEPPQPEAEAEPEAVEEAVTPADMLTAERPSGLAEHIDGGLPRKWNDDFHIRKAR